jgi:hypothetical protein
MEMRTLGAGFQVLALGLGCAGMSGTYGQADDADSIATIHAALDVGMTLLDTADFYGMGHNEMLIGRALRQGDREKAVLSVKFGGLRGVDLRFLGIDARPVAVQNFLAYSLRRVGADYVDIYRPARLDPAVPIEDTIGAIADLVQAGPRPGHRAGSAPGCRPQGRMTRRSRSGPTARRPGRPAGARSRRTRRPPPPGARRRSGRPRCRRRPAPTRLVAPAARSRSPAAASATMSRPARRPARPARPRSLPPVGRCPARRRPTASSSRPRCSAPAAPRYRRTLPPGPATAAGDGQASPCPQANRRAGWPAARGEMTSDYRSNRDESACR